jgi:DUF177 domain-containing protein
MIIQISNLSDGDYLYTFDKKVETIGLSEPFFGNIFVESQLQKSQRQIILNSKLKTNVNFECDRCGVEYEQELTNEFKIVYLFSSEINDEDQIDIKYISFETDTIKITPDVRDYALLAIPMKKLCKEDCKGLCIKCTENLNEGDCNCTTNEIDQRWLPLEKLRNKVN